MRELVALDLPLGPSLELAIRRCVDRGEAFCVLDQRLSASRRLDELDALAPTALQDAEHRSPHPSGRAVDDEVALVMLTSGTSGTPKAAELSHAALVASAHMTQSYLGGEGATWFPCLSAAHIGGLAVLLRAILADATLWWGDPEDFAGAIAHGATHVALVRTQLFRHDVRGFSTVLLGGARAPGSLPENVVTTWGMTETGSGIVYDGAPLPHVEVASVAGELVVRTPTLFRSYRHAPRPGVLGPDGREDWFPTGDAGAVRDGRVSVQGRINYVINSGGEKIWPDEIEAVLSAIDEIRDVAVFGVADPEWGEKLVALVVSDGTSLDEAIRSAAEEGIGPWAKPKEIRYVEAIPRTTSGKIRRGDLAQLR